MNIRTQALAGLAGLAVSCLVLVAACGGSGSSPAVSTTARSSATTSATSAPTQTLSPAEKDLNSAKDAVSKFVSVTDALGSDSYLSLGKLSTVATPSGKAIAHWRFVLTSRRVKQWKQVGKTSIFSSQAKATSGKSFDVTACLDLSKVNLVDKAGKSVVAAGRLPRVQYTYKVTKIPLGFFVDDDTVGGQAC
jgi:hypothetical protein